VVLFSVFAKSRLALGAITAAATFLGGGTAFANSSAATDIAAPLRAAQATRPATAGKTDEEFHKLFGAWQSYETTGTTALAAIGQAGARIGQAGGLSGSPVSVPSLMPVAFTRMSSGFGMREHPILGGERMHTGVDLAAPVGTPVHAAADGVVEMAKWYGGYGLFVELDHGGGIETRDGHMSQLNVADGQHVHRGDVIGYVGTTGRSTGPHLHYEVRLNGTAVNPLAYIHDQQTVSQLALNQAASNDSD
jgi:murein DD-endopeptidase MepM/ murein hydrolase activator NlpD